MGKPRSEHKRTGRSSIKITLKHAGTSTAAESSKGEGGSRKALQCGTRDIKRKKGKSPSGLEKTRQPGDKVWQGNKSWSLIKGGEGGLRTTKWGSGWLVSLQTFYSGRFSGHSVSIGFGSTLWQGEEKGALPGRGWEGTKPERHK